MPKTNLNKRITILGNISHDGKTHQSGKVILRGGCMPTQFAVQYKSPIKTVRKWLKKK